MHAIFLNTLAFNHRRGLMNISILACSAMLLVAGCASGDNHPGGGDSSAAGASKAPPPLVATSDSAASAGRDEEAGVHTRFTRLQFASQPEMPAAGSPAEWTLTILDSATGKPVEKFATVHDKLMHLIVASRDLSWFNHIHPEYQGNGRFVVHAVLPHAGTYRIYADYTPSGKSQEVAQHDVIAAGGAPVQAAAPLAADTIGADGWMLRSVVAAPEGEPGKGTGAGYQIALMPMPAHIVAGKDVMLHFQVRDGKGNSVTDLEPYLGAMGHAVLLSANGRIYLHTHPMEGEMAGEMGSAGMDHKASDGAHHHDAAPASGAAHGPNVMFHTNFPKPGLYKVWAQFRHHGLIITAPFVLDVVAG